MPRRGSRRKKTRTHEDDIPEGANIAGEGAAKADIPRSVVVRSSKVVSNIQDLIMELRKVMSPNTATNLREKSFNRLKDYITIAGQLALTHMIAISQTEANIVMKIARFSNGPTLHFKVKQYCLGRHVRASLKKSYNSPLLYITSPLVVLHNFNKSEESHIKLMRTTFQHMFPSISVKTVQLSECRRVVLFHFNSENGTVEMRHYAIRASPTGISKSIKKILQSKIPDLSQLEDVSEFVDGSAALGLLSDSEAEDDSSKVSLPDRFIGRGNAKSQQCSMKLTELGPRLTLELFKVERSVCEGEIIYHKYQSKSPEEAAKLQAKIDREKNLKQQRRQEQEENVLKKRALENETKQLKLTKKRQRGDSASLVQAERDEIHPGDGDDEDNGDYDDGDEEDGDDYRMR